MEDDPYELIFRDGKLQEVVLAAANMTYPQLVALAKEFDADHLTTVGVWAADRLHGIGLVLTIRTGAVLSLHHAVCVQRSEWREVFEKLLADYGIGKTTAYESMRVFGNFGSVLLTETELQERFPIRGLIELSRNEATPEARTEAINLARGGKYIDADLARELVKSHANQADPAAADDDQPFAEEGTPVPGATRRTKPNPMTTGPRRPRGKPFFEHADDDLHLDLRKLAKGDVAPERVLDFLLATMERFKQTMLLFSAVAAVGVSTYA